MKFSNFIKIIERNNKTALFDLYTGKGCLIMSKDLFNEINNLIREISESDMLGLINDEIRFRNYFEINGIIKTNKELMDHTQKYLIKLLKSKWIIDDEKELIKPENLNYGGIIIELTNKCNLNCRMCYASANEEPALSITYDSFCNQIIPIIKAFNIQTVGLSGGEPTVNKDFIKILEYLVYYTKVFIVLYTNGIEVSETVLDIIKEENKRFNIRVSLDGYYEATNDFIRGIGSFKKIINFLNSCKLKDISNVDVVFTGLNSNVHEYIKLSEFIKNEYGYICNFNLFLSSGRGASIKEDFDSINKEYIKVADELINKHKDLITNIIDFALKENSFGIYPCSLMSRNGLYITPNGDIMGCSSFKSSLITNINNSKMIDDLKLYKKNESPSVYEYENCSECDYRYICKGGCRLAAYQYSGNITGVYPYCSFAKKILNSIFND